MPEKPKVVIVEDDFLIQLYLESLCKDIGVAVLGVAVSATEAESMVLDLKPDFVLMDVRLFGERDGVDAALEIQREAPHIKIIFITGTDDPAVLERINTRNPYRVLFKPIDPMQFEDALMQ